MAQLLFKCPIIKATMPQAIELFAHFTFPIPDATWNHGSKASSGILKNLKSS